MYAVLNGQGLRKVYVKCENISLAYHHHNDDRKSLWIDGVCYLEGSRVLSSIISELPKNTPENAYDVVNGKLQEEQLQFLGIRIAI